MMKNDLPVRLAAAQNCLRRLPDPRPLEMMTMVMAANEVVESSVDSYKMVRVISILTASQTFKFPNYEEIRQSIQ